MPKNQTLFICKNCGNESAKWMGKCPVCNEWNTMVETERFQQVKGKRQEVKAGKPSVLKDVKGKVLERIKTGIKEFDKSLGGGFVAGQVLLLAGEPGIGKSTILLQIAEKLNSLYISGEESLSQIKIRTERLGIQGDTIYCLSETNIDTVLATARLLAPERSDGRQAEKRDSKADFSVLIIDSIQTMYTDDLPSTPGSVAQVKECALRLIRFSKRTNIPTILVGHVTKEGTVAGPSTLMHMVDSVCWFEGERQSNMRILRVLKNRFGSTDEISLFTMGSRGLIGVSDLDGYFFSKDRLTDVPGSVATCVIEGTRSVLVEVQALVNPSKLVNPRRVVQGIDTKRVELILAVMTKHCKLDVSTADVFVNIVGGIKVKDPGLDLAVAVAVASSLKNKAVPKDIAVIGEIGLLGDVRQTNLYKKCVKHLENHNLTVIGPEEKHISVILQKIFK